MGHGTLINPGVMEGLTRSGMKKHPSLIPLHFFLGLGLAWATIYSIRLLRKNPDCCIDRSNNPYPWQKLGVNGQYKMWSMHIDYAKLKAPAERPDIE